MIDLVKLILVAGDGGLGRVSFLRERRITKGGPDGGDGGKGGCVILRGNKNLATLKDFKGKILFQAQDGFPGGKKNMIGAKGKDLILDVPIGTSISVLAESGYAKKRRTFLGVNSLLKKDGVRQEKYYLEKEGQGVPERDPDNFYLLSESQFKNIPEVELETDQEIEVSAEVSDESEGDSKVSQESKASANTELDSDSDNYSDSDIDSELETESDSESYEEQVPEKKVGRVGLNEPIAPVVQEVLNAVKGLVPIEIETIKKDGQEIIVCQGGFGGRGNDRFKSSRNVTPMEAEYGSFGEKRVIVLELKLLADVGLVGFPNAGKSTLLSVVTKAKPKIASYPFTTIEPNLGILEFGDFSKTSGLEEIVLADIPGLIEGASEGKGLGHSFLRHVENCSTMLFVLALTETEVFDENLTDKQKAEILFEQLTNLKKELKNHSVKATSTPIGAGKKLFEDKEFLVSINKSDLYSKELIAEVKKLFKRKKIEVIFFSGVTKVGLENLAAKLREVVSKKIN